MKTQALAKGLRVTLTATEARFVAQVLENYPTPSTTPIAAGLRHGLVEVDAKASAARARRATDRARKAAEPKFRHFEVDGHRVSATQGDWFDASHDPDSYRWERIRPDEPWQRIPAQCEHRAGWWMIYVWAPDTLVRPSAIGEALIEHLVGLELAARRIIAQRPCTEDPEA